MSSDFKHQPIPIINTMTPNAVCDFDNFHISYNPRSDSAYGSFKTTALVIKNNLFLVLCGDHKENMLLAARDGGLDGCFDYFCDNLASVSPLSEHVAVVGDGVRDEFGISDSIHKTALEFLGEDAIARLKSVLDNS